ncbi:hypothetical protein D3C72_1451610 [compost metagenome]
MHQTRLVEAHFMLSRMDVNVHLMWIDFQIQHKRRLLIRAEFIFASLADRMVYQAIAHHAAIDVAILNFSQCRVHGFRIGHPTAHR